VGGVRRHQQLCPVGSGNTVSVFLSFFSSSQGNVRFLPIKGYDLDPNPPLVGIPSCPRNFCRGLGDEPRAPARSSAHKAIGKGGRMEDEREQREPESGTPSHRSIGRYFRSQAKEEGEAKNVYGGTFLVSWGFY
jgi:hypothetical protein